MEGILAMIGTGYSIDFVCKLTRRLVILLMTVGILAGCSIFGEFDGFMSPEAMDSFQDCDACPVMIALPSGELMMGTPESEPKREERENPQHKVIISKPFAIGKFLVTFDEWEACVNAGGCNGHQPEDQGWGRARRPVINVNWYDAQAYASWLTERTGETYRLLSEAEWEYAARGGTTTAYSFGDNENDLCQFANAADVSLLATGQRGILPLDCDDHYGAQTAPVGSFKPNPYGLYDVHGNVWEWVEDCFNDSYVSAPTDGSAWMQGDCNRHMLRSGSWIDARGGSLRSGHRGRMDADSRSYNKGFRVARDLN